MSTGLPKLSPARSGDIPLLPWLLVNFPENVLLRECGSGATQLLTELVAAPYIVTEEEGRFVFRAYDSKTHESVSLRVVDEGRVMQCYVCRDGQVVPLFATTELLVPSCTVYTARVLFRSPQASEG